MISNYETPTEKASEFLDSHLKTIMQESWSYIKDSEDFINKVTADVVGLYPSIPHKTGLKAIKNALEKRKQKHISTEKVINMGELVLKNSLSVLPLTLVCIRMR